MIFFDEIYFAADMTDERDRSEFPFDKNLEKVFNFNSIFCVYRLIVAVVFSF